MSLGLTFEDVLATTGARRAGGRATARIERVSTDTRTLAAGDLFIALSGPRHDGNAFAAEAVRRGAAALILRDVEGWNAGDRAGVRSTGDGAPAQDGPPIALHADPLAALSRLAARRRADFDGTVVGITGSSGKTSTKDALATLLSGATAVAKSPASFNNAVGVPHTILAAPRDVRVIVLELGTNAPGEIEALCRVARPTSGIVTGIGSAHLAGLGSSAGIAAEKGALPAALPRDGVCVVPFEDAFREALIARTSARAVTFGHREGADVVAARPRVSEAGTRFLLAGPLVEAAGGGAREVEIPLFGAHAARNVAAALAFALAAGFELDALLERLPRLAAGRSRMERHVIDGVTVIDDSYNANPDSVRAGLAVLAEMPARRRWVVLGGMQELGPASDALHRAAGADAAAVADVFIAVGDLARASAEGAMRAGLPANRVHLAGDVDAAVATLVAAKAPGDVVWIKASRAARLERVTEALLARAAERSA